MYRILVSFSLMLLLTACSMAPTKTPEEGGSLVVGRVVYNANGIKGDAELMNHLANGGIEVLYTVDGKKRSVRTSAEGLFHFYIEDGELAEIKKFRIERSNARLIQTYSYSLSKEVHGRYRTGINIGTFSWSIISDEWSLERLADHDMELKDMFAERYKNNPWLRTTWRTK